MRIFKSTAIALLFVMVNSLPALAAEPKPQPISSSGVSSSTPIQEQYANLETSNNLISFGDEISANTILSPANIIPRTTIILVSSEGIQQFYSFDTNASTKELLEKNSLDPNEFRMEDGTNLSDSPVSEYDETIFLFKFEKSVSNEKKVILPTVKIIKDERIPIGEEIVAEEGSNGTAIKTTTIENDLSKDSSVNDTAKGSPLHQTIETLTVITKPKEKLLLIGTGAKQSDNLNPGYSDEVPFLGKFDWPLSKISISSPFGMRVHPITHIYKLHDGTDFAASCGTPILASAEGKVTFVGNEVGYGNRVILDHYGYYTTIYNHMSKFNVKVGDVLKQGEKVGEVGETGYATGCHLHFMITGPKGPINPMTLLDKNLTSAQRINNPPPS